MRNARQLVLAALIGLVGASPSRAASLTTIATFDERNGANPYASLIADAAGNLYGTTAYGYGNAGTAFMLDKSDKYAVRTLATFSGSDGGNPMAGLIADADGNLYGTTAYGGGINAFGTVFKLDKAKGYAGKPLVTFTGKNGATPYAGLIADAAGNLYGTTLEGGDNKAGTVYKLHKGKDYALQTLASFDSTGKAGPNAGLIADAAGNLYGTTLGGGSNSLGTVFKLGKDVDGNYALTTLAAFDSKNGARPMAGLIADAEGNLYGTTYYGGSANLGTVFKLDKAKGYALETLASFDSKYGVQPYGGLIVDAAGNLYGTTSRASDVPDVGIGGTVFRLDKSSGYALETLVIFNGKNGASPYASLIADAAGNLYGTTFNGGEYDRGTVFRVSEAGFVTNVVPLPPAVLGGAALMGMLGLGRNRRGRNARGRVMTD